MVMGETYRMVWGWVCLAHNPEVAGSNPAPLPTSSQFRGSFPWERASCHVSPVARSLTRTVTRDVPAVPLRPQRDALGLDGTSEMRSLGRNPAVPPGRKLRR